MEERVKCYCILLLAGSILVEGTNAVLVNTVEVYGRAPTVDPYQERFIKGKAAIATTFPIVQ